MPITELTADRLRELLSYDPETGVFQWRVPGSGRKGGCERHAGAVKSAGRGLFYRVIWVDGRLYRAHRLAWLYVHGVWPNGNIDHVNGDGLDNRIANLRECDQRQNNGNHHRLSRHNTSGLRGVTWRRDRQKWKAYINRANRQYHLGYFATKDEAYAAFQAAAAAHFGEFART